MEYVKEYVLICDSCGKKENITKHEYDLIKRTLYKKHWFYIDGQLEFGFFSELKNKMFCPECMKNAEIKNHNKIIINGKEFKM